MGHESVGAPMEVRVLAKAEGSSFGRFSAGGAKVAVSDVVCSEGTAATESPGLVVLSNWDERACRVELSKIRDLMRCPRKLFLHERIFFFFFFFERLCIRTSSTIHAVAGK